MIEVSEEKKLFCLIGELYVKNKASDKKNSSLLEEVFNLERKIQELEGINQELRTLLAEPEEKQPQNKKDKKK